MTQLIINKRSELPRGKRVIWDGVTLMLWTGFIYLWYPVLAIFYRIVTSDVPSGEVSSWIYENISSVTFEYAVWMLVSTPVMMFLLSRLNRHRLPSEHLIYHGDDYAHYFGLDGDVLRDSQNTQCVTVYFDDHGHIVSLENSISLKSDNEGR
jgi:biofilm PGA synthesis protein PgaD